MISLDISATIGALEWGALVSVFLFGIETCQTYMYWKRYPQDSLFLKSITIFVWLMELGLTLALCHSLYSATIINVDSLFDLIQIPAGLVACIIFSAFIGPVVQAWFAYRLLKFSRMPYIPIFCWGLSLLRCLSTFVLGVEAGIANSLLEFEPKFKWLVVLVLAVGASEDVIIAFCLVYNFIQQRSNSSNVRTIGALNQLILWTIETGLLTSVAAVTMLICFLKMEENFVWVGIFTFISKLFSNSMLAALNARVTGRVEEGPELLMGANAGIASQGSATMDQKHYHDIEMYPHLVPVVSMANAPNPDSSTQYIPPGPLVPLRRQVS